MLLVPMPQLTKITITPGPEAAMVVNGEGMDAASCHHRHADAPKEWVFDRDELRHIAALAIVVPELPAFTLAKRKKLPITRHYKRVVVAAADGYGPFQRHCLWLVCLPSSSAAAKCQELAFIPQNH